MIQAVKGTKDLFGPEMDRWAAMERTIRKVCETFNIGEIRTPVFEYTELFVKSTGDTTDIVEKQMYTFDDKAGRSITLKPEVTASVVRAFIEHKLYAGALPFKAFYLSPCFRYEKPQAGRLRQFHQFGAEYFGAYGPAADAEVISLASEVLLALGISDATLHINSLGGSLCRARYNASLSAFLRESIDGLCPTCRERVVRNPLRVLDCKEESCQTLLALAPSTIDTLDVECRKHFETVLRILDSKGVAAVINPKMVRGLDYYTRTVFEFTCGDIGAQSAVCGGGRYDSLVGGSGGPEMGGMGFAMGLERLMLSLTARRGEDGAASGPQLFLGAIGEEGLLKAHVLAQEIRRNGFSVEAELMERAVKAQLKHANKIGAGFAVVIGADEIAAGSAKLKNMETGEQTNVALGRISEFLSEFLAKGV